MGYYVDGYGSVGFASKDEEKLVQALKDLNHRHELKTGGRFPKTGDPYEDSWFAWMPSRYHEDEDLKTVRDILELVGFECREQASGDLVSLDMNYNSKTGAEHVFLRALAENGADVSFHWTGEEGEQWKVRSAGNKLETQNSYLEWSDWVADEDAGPIANWNAVIQEITNAFE